MWHMYNEISDFWNTSLLHVTATDCTSMQELLMLEHKQKLYKTCSCCGRETWHIESKQILQTPKYLTIIVNRITYSNNRVTKNKSRMPLDIYIKLVSSQLLWTIMDTLWTVVITQPQSIVVGKHFTVTIIKLLNIILRIPIIHLLPIYFCTNSSWNVGASICLKGHLSLLALSSFYSLTVEDWELIDSHGAGTVVCPFTTGRGIGTETCGMDNVFPPDDL